MMLFLVAVLAHLLLVAAAVGEGFLLHWIVPGLDLSTCVLAGFAATISSVFVLVQIVRIVLDFEFGREEEGMEEDEDEEGEEDKDDDEEQQPPRGSASLPPFGSQRRRRGKRR